MENWKDGTSQSGFFLKKNPFYLLLFFFSLFFYSKIPMSLLSLMTTGEGLVISIYNFSLKSMPL